MAGCSSGDEEHWSEEVQLDDGSRIVIERDVKFATSNSMSGDAFSSTDLGSKLIFPKDLGAIPAWEGVLVPIVLYHDENSKEWVIVATTSNCSTWYEQGKPKPPYWEFRLKQNSWESVQLSKVSLDRKTNLFFNYEAGLPARKLTSETKDQILASKAFSDRWRSVSASVKTKCNY
jgi:hypothetical protein